MALRLTPHPRSDLVAFAPQPEQLGRGGVAQLAARVEGVAGVKHDVFLAGKQSGHLA
jgi:hypothetical protein